MVFMTDSKMLHMIIHEKLFLIIVSLFRADNLSLLQKTVRL